MLLEYWRTKCAGEDVPDRRQIHPRDVKDFLPHLSIVEARETGLVFRMTGSSLRDILGGEFRGRPLTELGTTPTAWTTAILTSLTDGVPTHGVHALSSSRAHIWMRLPLQDTRGRRSLVLCFDHIRRLDDRDDMAERDLVDADLVGEAGLSPNPLGSRHAA